MDFSDTVNRIPPEELQAGMGGGMAVPAELAAQLEAEIAAAQAQYGLRGARFHTPIAGAARSLWLERCLCCLKPSNARRKCRGGTSHRPGDAECKPFGDAPSLNAAVGRRW